MSSIGDWGDVDADRWMYILGMGILLGWCVGLRVGCEEGELRSGVAVFDQLVNLTVLLSFVQGVW